MSADNQLLALNFLEGIPVPRNALTDLFALSHFSPHHWLREQARSFFNEHAPRGFVLALQEELNFRKFTPHRHMEWFMRVRRRHVIDSPVLARYMYHWQMIPLPAYMKYGISEASSFFAPFIKGDKLDLSSKMIDEVPTDLQELVHLRHIDLSGNVLTRLGRIVARLPRLETLKVSGNQLQRLNPTIGRMSQLRWLDLSSNHIDRLPAGLSRLHRLHHLDLSRNELEELPKFLTELSRLEELHLTRNQLDRVAENLHGLKKLRKLYLGHNPGLKTLPESIGKLSSLRELHLGRTGVRVLPDAIGKLRKLEVVDLSRNQVEDLSPLFGLKELRQLDLSGSSIEKVPSFTAPEGRAPIQITLGGNQFKKGLDTLGKLSALPAGSIQIFWQGELATEQKEQVTELVNAHSLDLKFA